MNLTYVFLMWLVKASFLSLLAPPFLHLPLRYRRLFWTVAIYNLLTFLTVLSLNIFWCFPVNRNWKVFPLTAYCTPALSSTVFIVTFVLHITTDLTVLILPLFIISSLGMQSRREHAGIAFVFIIGGISVAASVARCVIAFSSGTFDMMSAMKTAQLEVWTPVEQNTAVIAACLPSMRVLIRRAVGSVREKSKGSREGVEGGRKVEKEWSVASSNTQEHDYELGHSPNNTTTQINPADDKAEEANWKPVHYRSEHYAGSGSEVELNWRRSAAGQSERSMGYTNYSESQYGPEEGIRDIDPRFIAIAR